MKDIKIYIILILLLFGSLAFVFAIDPCSQGFRVIFNEKEDIDCDDNSIVINENNNNQDIFVPTKTSLEWASFNDNSKRPDNVEIFYKEATTIPGINSDLNVSGEAIFFDGQFCVVWSEGGTSIERMSCYNGSSWTEVFDQADVPVDPGWVYRIRLITWDYDNNGSLNLCYQEAGEGNGGNESDFYCIKDDGSLTNILFSVGHDCHPVDYPVSPFTYNDPGGTINTIYLTGTLPNYNDTAHITTIYECNNQSWDCTELFSSTRGYHEYLDILIGDSGILCAFFDVSATGERNIICYNSNIPGTVEIGKIPNDEEVFSGLYRGDDAAVFWDGDLCVGTDIGNIYCGNYTYQLDPSGATDWVNKTWLNVTDNDQPITDLKEWGGRLYAASGDGKVFYYRPETDDWSEFFQRGVNNNMMMIDVNLLGTKMCSMLKTDHQDQDPVMCITK